MKKFAFALERVLEWRRTQARAEELKLEQLHLERSELVTRLEFLAEESGRARADLLGSDLVRGADLEALDCFRKSISTQVMRFSAALEGVERQIFAQIETVCERRRQLKLVEELRQEKFRTWHRACLKEIEQNADEAHLARLARPLS